MIHRPVGGPWFEDLERGQVFDRAPAVTITDGHAAVYEALSGDRLRLPRDRRLSEAVTGRTQGFVHPLLVCHTSIGQTTEVSERVVANLFYRGLVQRRPVFVGDTLHTTTSVQALRQNRPKAGRAATGLAVLRVHTVNGDGETVLDYLRCPMLPLADPGGRTGHDDDIDAFTADLGVEVLEGAVPSWRYDAFREHVQGEHFKDAVLAATYDVEGRDTVTSAPELVRMTLNTARVHTDAGASGDGRRLVYGGHTISVAGAQLTRALPNLVTILAWRSCDHTAPVYEGDILRSRVRIDGTHPLAGGHGLVDLHVTVDAERGDGNEICVLDWHPVGVLA